MNFFFKWLSCHGWLVPVIQLLTGLCTCQLLATVQLYCFSIDLRSRVEDAIGFFPGFIPNNAVLQDACSITGILAGALFFTATLGCGLSLLGLVVSYLIKSTSRFRLPAFLLFIVTGVFCLFKLNINGFSPFGTAYIIFIPLTIYQVGKKVSAETGLICPGNGIWTGAVIIMVFATAVWVQNGNRSFTVVRDRLLLTNTPGVFATQFYYRYSYLAGASIRSFGQNPFGTWVPDSSLKKSGHDGIFALMYQHGYRQVRNPVHADLILGFDGRNLVLGHAGEPVLAVSPEQFVNLPAHFLKRFNMDADRHQLLRLLSYYSLLIGLPSVFGIFLFSGLRVSAGLFLSDHRAGIIASGIMLIAAACLIYGLSSMPHESISRIGLVKKLSSADGRKRQAAYEALRRQNLDIGRFVGPDKLAASQYIPDRLWLATLLADSQHSERGSVLMRLIDDPILPVSCRAMRSLGQPGVNLGMSNLKQKVNTTTSWYLQECAHQSLSRR